MLYHSTPEWQTVPDDPTIWEVDDALWARIAVRVSSKLQ
jgi:hypothetical protein